MAYNVFKRPMFKRGGSTTGTGIMSHVEPRVKAQRGYGNYSAAFPYEKTQYYSSPINTGSGRVNVPVSSSGNYFQDVGFGKTLTGVGQELKKAGAAAYDLVGVPLNVLSEYFTGYQPGFSGAKFFNVPGVDQDKAYFLGMETDTKKTGIETVMPEKILSGGATSIDQIAKQNIAKQNAEKIQKELEQQKKEQTDKPAPTYEESDIKTDIENEIETLNKVLGPSISKAEKALLIAKSVGTPGSLSDKLKVAQDEGIKLAKEKTKSDRAIALTAYKVAKEKEKAEIAAGKKGETERLYDEYARLSVKKDKTPTEEKKLQALKFKLEKSDELETVQRTYALKMFDPNRLRSIQATINTYKGKKSLTKLEQEDLAKKQQEEKEQLLYKSILGLKEGGRVMKQTGGSMNEDSITSIENVTQDQVEPTKTVQTLSYAELRDRLPKEITDDIVQLIAASERALQDFAYIRTQQDVNDFNAKYGVNLVLPASAT